MSKKNIYVKDIYSSRKKNNKKIIISLCFTGLLITLIVILAYFGQNVGSFSIKLGDDLTTRQIFVSETEDFSWYDSTLEAGSVADANVTMYPFIKSHECRNTNGSKIWDNNSYVSYTFYVKNMGKETVNIMQHCSITGKTDGLEKVTWLEYFEDDKEGIVYQGGEAPNKKDDPACANYPETQSYDLEDRVAYQSKIYDLHPGQYKKITLITWVDAKDPDLSPDVLGGSIRFEIYFSLFRR